MKDIFAKHGLNCPVTHGLATRMSRESFAAACDAKRTQGEPSGISDGVLFLGYAKNVTETINLKNWR